MNWKGSLIGAVLVMAAGLAVGIGIGGKETVTTKTRTVTVTQPATPNEPDPASGDTGGADPVDPVDPPAPEPNNGRSLADLFEADDTSIRSEYFLAEAGPGTIGKELFERSINAELDSGVDTDVGTLEIQVPAGVSRFDTSLGLDPNGMPSDYEMNLKIRVDDKDGKVLFEETVLPGRSPVKVRLNNLDNVAILLVTLTEEETDRSPHFPVLVFGDAGFS